MKINLALILLCSVFLVAPDATAGKEKMSEEGSQKHFSRLYWEGETLVFVTRIVAPQGKATNTVRYQLREKGTVLQAEEKFRGPRLKYDNVWVFEKREKTSEDH